MTFTYVPGTDIGKIRFLIGDTVELESEISDEEIDAAFEEITDHTSCAIYILRSLAAKYSRRATVTSGNEKIENGNVARNLLAMVADLEASAGTSGVPLVSRSVRRV